MAALESCPKHNMIANLEKTEGNVEFHEVIDFLQRSYISHALTVSPVVSTTFVEQFWTSAKSKTINSVRHITAKVAGKLVSITEASIRTDLLFDDADGIDTLPNQAIFDAIQLMGYEGDLTQLESDEELARKVQEEWEAEEEKNKIAEEQATNEALIKDFDDIKARIEADRILAEKLQEQEREQFTIEERAKFLHDTIAAQRKTIQALYEKIKRFNEHFISTGSAKDERLIKKMHEKRGGLSKSEVIKEDTKEEVKDEDKDEESTRKRKLAQDEEKEVDYEVLDRKYPIIDWKTECLGTKPQPDEAKSIEKINLNVVFVRDLWEDFMVLFHPDEQDDFGTHKEMENTQLELTVPQEYTL
ncbi:hypothetical protein Tco_0163371 [Tanacetum coccineum]